MQSGRKERRREQRVCSQERRFRVRFDHTKNAITLVDHKAHHKILYPSTWVTTSNAVLTTISCDATPDAGQLLLTY